MWAKIDDGFFRHPKARAAGKDGRALFVAGLCWSASHLTDGFIAKPELGLIAAEAEVNATRTVRLLVESGMWEPVEGGWSIHDFHDFNPSADEMRERRRKRSEAGRVGGKRSKPPGSKPEATGEANTEALAQANAKPNRTPSPSPSPTAESFTANPVLKGQLPAAGGIFEQAATIVAERETERRKTAGHLANPRGYLRSRIDPLRRENEPFWRTIIDAEPTTTAQQLADALDHRSAPVSTPTCGVCGTENPTWCGDDCPLPPQAKVVDLMQNLERSVTAAKRARNALPKAGA